MSKTASLLVALAGLTITGSALAEKSPKVYANEIGSYYQFIGADMNGDNSGTNERKNWKNAQADCVARQGHLATITSAKENEFLRQQGLFYSNNYLWIGANRGTAAQPWTWITGETWNFTNWAEDQPGTGADEHHAMLDPSDIVGAGYWSTVWDTAVGNYVCEWEGSLPLDTVALDDMTGDEIREIGLYKLDKGVRTVRVINPSTGATVTTIPFDRHPPMRSVIWHRRAM